MTKKSHHATYLYRFEADYFGRRIHVYCKIYSNLLGRMMKGWYYLGTFETLEQAEAFARANYEAHKGNFPPRKVLGTLRLP